jgi:protein-S-isoprenylcysteine O-methyltransferase Ste14
MEKLKTIIGKILYGTLFMLALPACLYLWANSTKTFITVAVPHLPVTAMLLLISGCIIVAWGMLSLIIKGEGLPMNAYPPKKFVYTGIYGLIKHPIYAGSGMIAFGCSLYYQSAPGFWMVSPVFCVAMLTFVVGYEDEMIKNAGGYFNRKVFFSLPEQSAAAPMPKDRLKVFVLALLPWLIGYELFIFSGIPPDAIVTNFPFEKSWPVLEWSEIFYLLPYLLVVLVPFVLATRAQVRSFILDVQWAMFAAFFMYLVFPFVVAQRPFTPGSFFGELIYLERSYDSATAALPAFHVIWAFILSKYFAARFGKAFFWQLLAVLISLSCIGNGSHAVLDVVAGYLIFQLVNKRNSVWNTIRCGAERIANSWKDWRWGELRLINHGFYAGMAAFAGMLIVGACLERAHAFTGFCIGLCAIAGAAVWAQWVEGSPRLLRPYGYYGSVVGIFVSVAAVSVLCDIPLMYLLAAFALAGPLFQVFGRLRCLVQGCCHGKPCNPTLGLRFNHPQSRVLKMASLKGMPIYPTQLYSIGSNILIALILFRLVSLHMPVSFIAGSYLILNGLARFAEEALRGEPQTVYWRGLRLYQWLAIVSIAGGAFTTTIHAPEHISMNLHPAAIGWALLMGIIATICYGVDFPNSGKRFARLTS